MLSNASIKGKYVVVEPVYKIEGYEENIQHSIGKISPIYSNLIERLYEINKTPPSFTLKSSPDNGYLIDYDGEFASLFEKGGSGWNGWRSSYPNATCNVEVSFPAYDPSSGFALVYVGWQGDYLFGRGDIISYIDTKMER